MAERAVMMASRLISSNFFTITKEKDVIRAPNPETAKLRKGLKQVANFSFASISFL